MNKVKKVTVLRKPGPDSPGAQSSEQAPPGRSGGLVVLLILLGLVLVSCDRGSPAPTPVVVQDTAPNSPSRGQGGTPGRVVPPSPTAAPARPGTEHKSINEKAGTGGTEPRVVTATNSTATSLTPGWTRYDSINQAFDLTFAPDGTLWAATSGGLVHWVPDLDTYTRYAVWPSQLALAPDGTLWLVLTICPEYSQGTTARKVGRCHHSFREKGHRSRCYEKEV